MHGAWKKDLFPEAESSTEAIMQLLQHPTTTNPSKETRIGALLSPSSTLEEVKQHLELITHYYNNNNNNNNDNSDNNNVSNNIEILTTAGVHPYHAETEPTEKEISLLHEYLSSSSSNKDDAVATRICAVGECGLDYSEGFPSRESQLAWFRVQVKLAVQYKKPLFIHERLAHEDLLKVLDEEINDNNNNDDKETATTNTVPIIVHCFTGTREHCETYMKRGYYVSVSGFICKKNGDEVGRCIADGIIPLDRLMIETDAPYMGFDGCRDEFLKLRETTQNWNGKKRKKLYKSIYPNVPSALNLVLDKVVQLLLLQQQQREDLDNVNTINKDEVARITSENAIRFFGFRDFQKQENS